MPTFNVAHLQEQGQNMILFPLDSSFGNKTSADQNDVVHELTYRANAAGLAGTAVVFWQSGGRTHFMGPRLWQGFLSGLTMRDVQRNVNKSISWDD
mgnify:CR=1 FL=1